MPAHKRKYCPNCYQTKSVRAFYPRKPNGRESVCKVCNTEVCRGKYQRRVQRRIDERWARQTGTLRAWRVLTRRDPRGMGATLPASNPTPAKPSTPVNTPRPLNLPPPSPPIEKISTQTNRLVADLPAKGQPITYRYRASNYRHTFLATIPWHASSPQDALHYLLWDERSERLVIRQPHQISIFTGPDSSNINCF